jgi:hypothetical protein
VIILPVVMVDMEAHRMEEAAAVHTAQEEQVHMAAEAVRRGMFQSYVAPFSSLCKLIFFFSPLKI